MQNRYQTIKRFAFYFIAFYTFFFSFSHNLDVSNTRFADFQVDSAFLSESALQYGHSGLPHTKYGLLVIASNLARYTPDPEVSSSSPAAPGLLAENQFALVWDEWTSTHLHVGQEFYFRSEPYASLIGLEVIDGGAGCIATFSREVSDLHSLIGLRGVSIYESGVEIESFQYAAYQSQPGLQGHVFQLVGRLFRGVPFLSLRQSVAAACTVLSALAFLLVVLLIHRLYHDLLLSSVFYLTFLLSPYIINFSHNTYWLPFTWFAPMIAGLLYCCFPQKRRLWFALAFLSVLIKSLCGFEYISTVLVGMMLFPFCQVMKKPRREQSRQDWKDLFLMGGLGCAAFLTSICLLAFLRGAGNPLLGFAAIWREDVQRRTYGAVENFSADYTDSLAVSPLQVLSDYLYGFSANSREIISGIPANLFPILPVLCLLIFGLELAAGKLDRCKWLLFSTSLMGSVSWILLAKAHSYVHIGINDVIWYFGYVQMCLYILARFLIVLARKSPKEAFRIFPTCLSEEKKP